MDDDDGDTVSIAGCERARYWRKNTVLYCWVLYLGSIAELQERGCDIDRLLRHILLLRQGPAVARSRRMDWERRSAG